MASRTVPSMSLSADRIGRDLCRKRRDDRRAVCPSASEVVYQQRAQDMPVVGVEACAEQVLDVRIIEEVCVFHQEADLGREEGLGSDANLGAAIIPGTAEEVEA